MAAPSSPGQDQLPPSLPPFRLPGMQVTTPPGLHPPHQQLPPHGLPPSAMVMQELHTRPLDPLIVPPGHMGPPSHFSQPSTAMQTSPLQGPISPTHVAMTTTSVPPLLSSPGPDGPLIPPGTEPDVSGPVWIEHRTSDGQLYYSDPQTQRTTWEKPTGARIIPFNEPTAPPVGNGRIPGGVPVGPGMSGPRFPGVPPGVPLVPQRVWSDHKTPDGKVYYYNKVTRQSVWEEPKDFELIMPLPADISGPQSNSQVTVEQNKVQQEVPSNVPAKVPLPLLPTPLPAPNLALLATVFPPTSANLSEPKPEAVDEVKKEQESMEVDEKELLALVAAKLGTGPVPIATPVKASPPKPDERKGPRPVESIPVPGTPWSVVFTNDGRRFFFDATNKKSIWKIPPELKDSPVVVKIMENPPWKKKRVGELEEPATKRMKLEDDDEDEEDDNNDNKADTAETKMEGIEVTPPSSSPAPIATNSENVEKMTDDEVAMLRATLSIEERQEMFKAMLLERGVSAFSTWEKELPKFVFDDRYQLLLPKERKIAFEEFIISRAEAEMKEKKLKVKEKKDNFLIFLKESKITTKTSFSDFARQYGRDERFKAIEKMKERESLFNEYVNEMKKLAKERDEQQKMEIKNKAEKEKVEFLSMLKEQTDLNERSQWRKVKSLFQKDPRYKVIESSSKREELFNEYIKSLNRDERQERIAASLREREKEVQLSRSAQEKQWDKERDQLRKTEAQEHFKALLVDLVKNPFASWNESKRQLRQDQRWELSEKMINIDDREKMFRDHTRLLAEKRRTQFRKLLEDTPKITLKLSWKKARKYIKDDIRYKNFADSDYERETEYDRFVRDKLMEAKNDFRSLLKETKMINYKTKDAINESEKHYKDLIDTLKNDKRYLILECIEEEREEILMKFVDELSRKGPPPPPTATHPSERLKK